VSYNDLEQLRARIIATAVVLSNREVEELLFLLELEFGPRLELYVEETYFFPKVVPASLSDATPISSIRPRYTRGLNPSACSSNVVAIA
jgi:hypothetical protein